MSTLASVKQERNSKFCARFVHTSAQTRAHDMTDDASVNLASVSLASLMHRLSSASSVDAIYIKLCDEIGCNCRSSAAAGTELLRKLLRFQLQLWRLLLPSWFCCYFHSCSLLAAARISCWSNYSAGLYPCCFSSIAFICCSGTTWSGELHRCSCCHVCCFCRTVILLSLGSRQQQQPL